MPVRTGTVDFGALDFGNFESLWSAVDIRLGVFNSLWLAGGAATLCAALGFVLAIAVVRRPNSLPIAAADYLIAMPTGIPGPVFGFRTSSEDRRVGKECVIPFSTRFSPSPL